DDHAGADPDRVGHRRGERQGLQGIENVGRRIGLLLRDHEVIAEPDVVEALLLCRGVQLAARPRRDRLTELRKIDADACANPTTACSYGRYGPSPRTPWPRRTGVLEVPQLEYEATVGAVLHRAVHEFGDRRFIVTPERRMTFAEAEVGSRQLA